MRALLDTNVLLALLDCDHIHHEQSRRWFEREVHHGWASCAITQNGCIRILSQPSYPSPVSPVRVVELLSKATSDTSHAFWPCDISILDGVMFDHSRIHGPRQLTDAYLLGLATRHGGRLVTLDRKIAHSAVKSARPRNLVVL